jgi:O-antigen ligase
MRGVAESRSGSATLQILLPCSLILALSLAPPETRGESAAGCAALILILAILACAAGPDPVMGRVVLALAALSWPVALSSAAPGKAIAVLSVWVLAIAAGFGIAVLVTRRQAEHWIGGTLALAGALAGLHGLVQRIWFLPRLAAVLAERTDVAYHQETLDRVLDGRAFGAFSTPAALGGFMTLVLPITLVLAWHAGRRQRALLVVAALLQVAGLISAASATALVSLAVALALAGLSGLGSHGGRRLVLVAVLVVLTGGTLVAVLRGAEILNPTHGNNPLRLRAGNIRVAGEMAADHPWIGVGPGGYGERYPSYRRADDNESMHAHNLPMELVAEFGVPAGSLMAVLFFGLFLAPSTRAWNRGTAAPPWRRAAAVGLAAFAIHNLADYTAYMPSLLWLAALLLGVLAPPRCEVRPPGSRVIGWSAVAMVLLAAGVTAAGGLAWNARGRALAAEAGSDTVTALRHADRAVALAPWDPDARLLLCRLYLLNGRLPEAAVEADAAIRLAPFRPGARGARSMVRQQSGDIPGAWSDALEASGLYPVDPDYRVRAVELGRRVEGGLAGD